MARDNIHSNKIIAAGEPLKTAKKVLIMLHGRGADAQDMLGMAPYFNLKEFAILAPTASNNSWYPQSFLANQINNEPWLSAALDLIKGIVKEIQDQGIAAEKIYFLGFSQGACLTLEYVARNAQKYGGVVAFTGGLIGDKIYSGNYTGNFMGTPIFIGSSNPDIHVPVERVKSTTSILTNMNAAVTEIIYPNLGHTINQDEILNANKLIFDLTK